MRIEWKHKLSVKLTLVLFGILLVNLSVYTYFTTSRLEFDLIQTYSRNAYELSDVIKKSTRYSMLLNRREDVHQIIRTIARENEVERIRIYNKSGDIIFSTDSAETQRTVNLHAEACTICHSGTKTLTVVSTDNLTRIYNQPGGKKVLGVINPIENENECYGAGCHEKLSEKKFLGVLDVVISFDQAEKIIRANKKSIFYGSIALTVMISVFSGVFVTVLVNRPIGRINRGIQEISNGNLSYKIQLNSKDELGQLAARFNEMASRLNAAYREIREWSENLNSKVNEKTDELKKVYEQIIQIEKLAALGKLSATVAHELNNPLAGILTFSKLIAKQLRDIQKEHEFAQTLEYLSMISDESSRCGKIVKDLLDFSHRGDEVFVCHDLHDLIRKSLALIRHHLELHRIEAEETFASEPSDILCDPLKIQQALLALFMNAIEAIGQHGKLSIQTLTAGENIILRIKDTGMGIQSSDLPHIFEPFYTTKGNSKGTGLGLAVVYGIVTHHRGDVCVEETSAKGTVFKIKLPIAVKPG
jgi:two-component system NtrC family sensor kinase